MELRWHVKFNRRQLDRVKNDLKLRSKTAYTFNRVLRLIILQQGSRIVN